MKVDSIFLSSYSSNIFCLLGLLEKIKPDLERVEFWSCLGNSSLILFFKVLGYNYLKSFDELKKVPFIEEMTTGFNLFLEDEENKKAILKSFLLSYLKNSTIFNEKTTLEEVKKLTKISLCFPLWDEEKEKEKVLDEVDTPEVLFIDAVLASLTCLGIYSNYIIDKKVYKNLQMINPFPKNHIRIKKDHINIFNVSNFSKDDLFFETSPLQKVEKELVNINYCNHKKLQKNNTNSIFLPSFLKKEVTEKYFKEIFLTGYKSGEIILRENNEK